MKVIKKIVTLTLVFSLLMSNSVFAHNIINENFTEIKEGILVSRNISEKSIKKSLREYNKIPVSIRNAFIENGYQLFLLNSTEDDNPNSSYIGQTFLTAHGYSDVYVDLMNMYGTHSIIHEAGHEVDMLYRGGYTKTGEMLNASSTPQWIEIYFRNFETLSSFEGISGLNMYDSKEAFAECFALAYTAPTSLNEYVPEVYSYIKAIENWFDVYYADI